MRVQHGITSYSFVMILGLAAAAYTTISFAQEAAPAAPAAAAPAGQPARPRGPRPKPTNIQALPKDITGDEISRLMRQYEDQLGVECEYCHAKNPETHKNDFPSDANPMKATARLMIHMTADVNAKYLATMGTGPDVPTVNCGTCHRGMAHPPEFVPKPHAPQAAPAAPAKPM